MKTVGAVILTALIIFSPIALTVWSGDKLRYNLQGRVCTATELNVPTMPTLTVPMPTMPTRNRAYQMSAAVLLSLLLLVSQRSLAAPSSQEKSRQVELGVDGSSDPFEPANRIGWSLNYEYLDRYAFRPVVHGYVDWIPAPIRDGVGNFVDNFDEPNNTVNNLLVGRVADSGRSILRFVLNTTLGLLGTVDVADGMGLSRRSMSMSTVLGKATVEQGPYFMVPVYGPTTLRNMIGDTVDGLYFPYGDMSFAMRATHWVISGLDSRSRLVDQEAVLDNSLDPYLSSKDFYLQYEEAKVQEGRAPGKSSAAPNDAELERYMDEIDQ